MLTKRIKPNVLLADEISHDDESLVIISGSKLSELGLFGGDTVLLSGKKRKDTIAIVGSDDEYSENKIQLSKMIRSNLRLTIIYNPRHNNLF